MTPDPFLRDARRTYADANAGTLRWMLARPPLGGSFLNTKVHSVTLADYTSADGSRSPDCTYGWIQGRGLESLATHANFFDAEDAALAASLDAAAGKLHTVLDQLQARDGHAYFCYDRNLATVYPDASGAIQPHHPAPGIYSYADIFVAKGLLAADHRLGRTEHQQRHLDFFDTVVAAIEDSRFQINERVPLSHAEVARQPDDFGPRMILLAGGGLLRRTGHADHAAYCDRFIAHVLERHLDARSGLLRNVPGLDPCNVGHGIEFVGFALDHLPQDADAALVRTLENILIASFRAGYAGPGIALSISADTGQVLNPLCPWWSLPETIRSAALCYARTGNPEALAVWKEAHGAFFTRYWRGEPALAYQTMNQDGPIDFVPATPDLDPGYHTGLSLLAAIEVADALVANDKIRS
ncbi:MAG TPA: hypothetical protein PK286_02600 [Devosia sp.]|nr:hypothetical protein [Devosia sp.]